MNITIIGTSHIAKQSINEVKKAISSGIYDIVAVELDTQRATALLQEHKNKISLAHINAIGFKGYIFAKVGQIVQQKLGKMVGVAPGADMKAALESAYKEKKEIALIDQPIQITLKNFSKRLTWKEKGRFVWEILLGIVRPKRQMKELGFEHLDLSKVPEKEFITKMINQIKNKFPSIHKTLIVDRNRYMVKSLIKLMRQHPDKNILAVVGAGHEEGMKELLNRVDVVR